MYATGLFGWVALGRNHPWHVVGSAGLLLLFNIASFTLASNTPRPWNALAFGIQVVATATATVSIRREWAEWRSQCSTNDV
jgi:hypothetical protein